MEAETGALIVGAGPTGLMVACELARRGAAFRILAAADRPSAQVKAAELRSRSLELLDDMGLLEAAEELGVRVYGMTVYAEGRRVLHAGYEDLDAPHPFKLVCGQVEIERLLGELLARLGGHVEWRSRVREIGRDGDGVVATVGRPDGAAERIRARHLIGCDGAQSTVRDALGGRFESTNGPEDWILGDVRLDWALPRDEQYAFLSGADGFTALACQPSPGDRWQVAARLPVDPRATGRGGSEPRRRSEPALPELRELFERACAIDAQLGDPGRLTIHRVHRGSVRRRVAGPLILAGDAAQVRAPVGGAGMNAGIQDAHNLGWKLALALEGIAGPRLIESYDIERAAVTRQPFSLGNRNHLLASLRRPLGDELRERLIGFLADFDSVTDRSDRDLAQIAWDYRDSPIVDEESGAPLPRAGLGDQGSQLAASASFARGPRAGDRAPDSRELRTADGDPGRLFEAIAGADHVLLMFLGCERPHPQTLAMATAIARRVRQAYDGRVAAQLVVPAGRPVDGLEWEGPMILDPTEALHNRYGARGECLVLIRPDRYIGFRAQPPSFQALARHLAGIFSPTAIVSR